MPPSPAAAAHHEGVDFWGKAVRLAASGIGVRIQRVRADSRRGSGGNGGGQQAGQQAAAPRHATELCIGLSGEAVRRQPRQRRRASRGRRRAGLPGPGGGTGSREIEARRGDRCGCPSRRADSP